MITGINNYSAFALNDDNMMKTLNADTDNLPITCNLVKIMPSVAGLNLTGLLNPVPEMNSIVWIVNLSMSNSITLKNMDASSDPENQFKMQNNVDFLLLPGQFVQCLYCGGKYRINA